MSWNVWSILSIVNYASVLVAIEHIIRRRREPRGSLAWILALLLLPGVGLILFLLIGQVPIQRKVRRRLRRRRLIEPSLAKQTDDVVRRFDALDFAELEPSQKSLMRLATRMGEAVVTRGNEVVVYHDAERVFLAMGLAIEAAKSHVHMEYYILQADETGRAVGDLLMRKARDGVEVRLLLDAVGCWRLPRSYVRQLQRAGVKVAFFLPWGMTGRRFNLNCRNHRKLVMVDGRVGFTGSQNIGDEYLGRRRRYGPWRDTHLRIRGPAAVQLQEIFVEDWHFATREDLASATYFPEPAMEGSHLVQLVASGPDRRPDVMLQLLYAAVSDARGSIALMTPYFVPDRAMLLALQSASHRGVRVRLLLPSRSDHWFVLWAGRSFYEELLEAGVEVFEYGKGMLHSKVVVVDRRWAMVGSANMDERSFRLNFELTALLYDAELAQGLAADIEVLQSRASRIGLQDVRGWSYRQSLAAGAARLATPLL